MTAALDLWLDASRRSCDMQVEQIPRSRSKEWIFDGRRLHHITGGHRRTGEALPARPTIRDFLGDPEAHRVL